MRCVYVFVLMCAHILYLFDACGALCDYMFIYVDVLHVCLLYYVLFAYLCMCLLIYYVLCVCVYMYDFCFCIELGIHQLMSCVSTHAYMCLYRCVGFVSVCICAFVLY